MDLNQPPVDDGSNEVVQQNNTMSSFHVPSNQGRLEENGEKRSEALGLIPDWLTQLVNYGNNPHRALEQFQSCTPLHLTERPTSCKPRSGYYK